MLNSIAALYGTGAVASTTAYESIATVTVGSGGSSSISFSSIPTTYKTLELRWIAKTNRSGASDVILINPNGSATTTGHYLYGNGTSATAGVGNGFIGWATGTSVANVFAAGVLSIIDYADTNKNKVTRSLGGYDNNSAGELALFSNLQTSTTALTSLTITSQNSATFQEFSQFALYGVK